MYKRENMQPEPFKFYTLRDKFGNTYLGRWLSGNKSYEGWYLRSKNTPMINPMIKSQKELKIVSYSDKYETHRYIPKKILDEAFDGKDEVIYPKGIDIFCYL